MFVYIAIILARKQQTKRKTKERVRVCLLAYIYYLRIEYFCVYFTFGSINVLHLARRFCHSLQNTLPCSGKRSRQSGKK